MKTIQQVIREMDPAEIEQSFFYDFPITLEELPEDLTVKELKMRRSERFQEFLKSLLETELKPGNKRGILFLSKVIGEDNIKTEDLVLVHADELLTTDNLAEVPHYAFEFTPRSEALAFLVSDNKLTHDWLMTVVIKFLREMSFFGFDEQRAIEEGEELERRAKEVEEHPERLIKFDPDEFREEYGLPIEEVYPKEDDLEDSQMKATVAFNDYCRTVELERIKAYVLGHLDEVADSFEVSLDGPLPLGALML